MTGDGELTALQRVLAGEHAAIYGYGVIGPRVPSAQRAAVSAAYDSHRARRDELAALIRARGAEPVAAAPAYLTPPLPDAAAARTLAVAMERALARHWAELVAATGDPALRRLAATALAETAVRSVAWGAGPQPFPGLPATPPPPTASPTSGPAGRLSAS